MRVSSPFKDFTFVSVGEYSIKMKASDHFLTKSSMAYVRTVIEIDGEQIVTTTTSKVTNKIMS